MSLRIGLFLTLGCALAMGAASRSARADDEIIVPYESVRSAGMGGVSYTTGLYEDNFFSNPARVTANPKWRITLLDPTVEVSSTVTPSSIGPLIHGGSDFYHTLGNLAGENFHARVESTFPAFYIPPGKDGKWGFAAAMVTSTQADVNLEQSFNIDPLVVTDVGPAVTVGRMFLPDNSLSVGMTAHLDYRLSSTQGFSFIDLIQGKSLSPVDTGGQGTGLDFDLGTTYQFHWHPLGTNVSAAFAVDDILDGRFNNIKFQPIKDSSGDPTPSNLPLQQPRTFNAGVAAMRPSLGILSNTSVALEFTDFGNNANGSFYRTIHMGGETHWGILAGRLGLNQGYFAAGAGIDLKVIEIDAATYGEELSLNDGGSEDRRYAIRVALQI